MYVEHFSVLLCTPKNYQKLFPRVYTSVYHVYSSGSVLLILLVYLTSTRRDKVHSVLSAANKPGHNKRLTSDLENTRRLHNGWLKLGRRRRRRANIKPPLCECLMFSVTLLSTVKTTDMQPKIVNIQ